MNNVKSMFDNLNAIVANTLTDSIEMIDISELHESKDNFFVVERIEEFAETILGQGGVKDNLIVRPIETGGYEIISGHRRRAAVQYLIDKGENISHLLPCLVQNYTDEDSKLIDIVLMNVSARQLSDSELLRSFEILNETFQNKKSLGEKFGRVREKLADSLGVSPAQVGKMQNIENNAIEAVVQAVKDGDISISTANDIAKLDIDEQEELLKTKDFDEIKSKDIKKPTVKKEKVDTNINFYQETKNKQSDDETLTSFINKNYYELNSILTAYTSMATDEEIKLINKFQKLITRIKKS